MALIDGDDFVDGNKLSFQQKNRMKNNWRDASAPSNPSPGMLFSDSDDDKLYHRGAAAWYEIFQSGGPSAQTAIPDATDAADAILRINDIIHMLEDIGLLET